jgi:hypothetical protein
MHENKPLDGSDGEILEQVKPVFKQIMAAHEEGDYEKIEPYLSEEMREALSEETFSEIILNHLSPLGDLVATQYMGSLKKQDATQTLWRTKYNESEVEVLWQVFFAQDGHGIQVVGLLFS